MRTLSLPRAQLQREIIKTLQQGDRRDPANHLGKSTGPQYEDLGNQIRRINRPDAVNLSSCCGRFLDGSFLGPGLQMVEGQVKQR